MSENIFGKSRRKLTMLYSLVMIVFLALVVGTIVIALFLPMIDILQGLQQ